VARSRDRERLTQTRLSRDDVRIALAVLLRERLRTADTTRVTSPSGGHYASRADLITRQLAALDNREPIEIESWRLPLPWRDDYRPPRRVVIATDGTIR